MKKQTVDYDVLATSSPINAQAGLDFGARGDAEDGAMPDDVHLLHAVRTMTMCPQPQFVDLTGLVKGRLTVIGRCKNSNEKGARFLVRCTCGRYEVRSRKALRPECPNDRCQDCHDLEEIRAGRKPPPQMQKSATAE